MNINELTGKSENDSGWFCLDLIKRLRSIKDDEEWFRIWNKAKTGNCIYKDECDRYQRTIKNKPKQLILF